MKKILFVLSLIILNGCAPAQQTIQGYSMIWSCGNNTTCANHMHAWRGSGDFTSESDCLLWETAFINNYYGSSVTSCTGHY